MRWKTLYAWNIRRVLKLLERKNWEGKKIGVEGNYSLTPSTDDPSGVQYTSFFVCTHLKSQIHNTQQPCPHNWTQPKNNGYESVVCEGLLYVLRISSMSYPAITLFPDLTKRIQHKNEIPLPGKTAGIKDDITKKKNNATKISWKIEITATITHHHLWCLNKKTTAEFRRQFLQMFPTTYNRTGQDTEKQCKKNMNILQKAAWNGHKQRMEKRALQKI